MEYSGRCSSGNTAQARYVRRFVCCMTGYVATLCLAVYFLSRHHPTGVLLYTLAILPALAIIAIIAVVGIYLGEEQDEFLRTVLIQSFLWSIGLTLATTTVWGFLENFAGTVPFQPYLTFPLFWLYVGVTGPLVKRRYR